MLKTFNVRDVLEKEVVRFGNGSMVHIPKKWLGEKVLVVLEEKQLDVEAEVMALLKPHLDSVEGIFLYGSFARKEQTENSDVDVLVICDKKLNLGKIGKIDFISSTKENFIKELKKDSTLFLHQLVLEAKPILNKSMLEELKKAKINPNFEEFFDDTIGAFKKTKQLLEENKDTDFLDSNTTIYSLILRLKGLFLIRCHVKNSVFSNKKFMEFIKSHGFDEKTINEFFEAYRSERDEKNPTIKIKKTNAEKLFETAKIEFLKTKDLVEKWQKTNTKNQ